MTDRHDDKRREPRLPTELALVAERLGRAGVILPPAHLRGRVLGGVIDALGTDDLAEADLLPPSRDEPWPAAVVPNLFQRLLTMIDCIGEGEVCIEMRSKSR
jgi:hypothetical protein